MRHALARSLEPRTNVQRHQSWSMLIFSWFHTICYVILVSLLCFFSKDTLTKNFKMWKSKISIHIHCIKIIHFSFSIALNPFNLQGKHIQCVLIFSQKVYFDSNYYIWIVNKVLVEYIALEGSEELCLSFRMKIVNMSTVFF